MPGHLRRVERPASRFRVPLPDRHDVAVIPSHRRPRAAKAFGTLIAMPDEIADETKPCPSAAWGSRPCRKRTVCELTARLSDRQRCRCAHRLGRRKYDRHRARFARSTPSQSLTDLKSPKTLYPGVVGRLPVLVSLTVPAPLATPTSDCQVTELRDNSMTAASAAPVRLTINAPAFEVTATSRCADWSVWTEADIGPHNLLPPQLRAAPFV